jgi:hypothetical protein
MREWLEGTCQCEQAIRTHQQDDPHDDICISLLGKEREAHMISGKMKSRFINLCIHPADTLTTRSIGKVARNSSTRPLDPCLGFFSIRPLIFPHAIQSQDLFCRLKPVRLIMTMLPPSLFIQFI